MSAINYWWVGCMSTWKIGDWDWLDSNLHVARDFWFLAGDEDAGRRAGGAPAATGTMYHRPWHNMAVAGPSMIIPLEELWNMRKWKPSNLFFLRTLFCCIQLARSNECRLVMEKNEWAAGCMWVWSLLCWRATTYQLVILINIHRTKLTTSCVVRCHHRL